MFHSTNRPSGSLLATSQRRPNKHDIAFFEKNGLRHGEFTLPFGVKDVKVCEVMWNLDSTVLAVWAEDLEDGEGTLKKAYGNTLQSLYNTLRYNIYLDITRACCGSPYLPWNFTKEL